jgi:hypothetical protein
MSMVAILEGMRKSTKIGKLDYFEENLLPKF